jgi:N-acetylglucosamine-6-phosphate deacetylase
LERKIDEYTEWLEGRCVEVIDGDFTGEQIHSEMKAFRRRHGLRKSDKMGVIVDGFKDLDVSGGDGTTAEEKHTAKQLQKAAKRCNAGLIPVSHITKISDDVAIIKENIKGSGTQFQGARQVLIFQDAGLDQIVDENYFILSATKANFAHGGSAVLRRDESVLKYEEM